MRESTIDRFDCASPPEPGRADRHPSSGGSADAGPGDRGRGRRLDGRNGAPARRAGPPPGGPQRLPAQADDHHRRRADRGPAAAGARSTAGGPGGAVHLEDSAAVPAKDQEHGGVDPLAVPQGRQHGRLQRGPGGAGRAGLSRACRPRPSPG